jgi:hypothetical protein
MTDRLLTSPCWRPRDPLIGLQPDDVIVRLVVTEGVLVHSHSHGEDVAYLADGVGGDGIADHS